MSEPKIILIGGPQATGKTTLAKALSSRLDIPWISTDQIRTIEGITTKNKEVLEDEIKNNEGIWTSVERFIRSPYPWENVIVEGVAILPYFVASLDIKVKPVFIIDSNRERVAEVIRQRSLLPWVNTKSDEQQEARVSYILKFNEYIRTEAQKYNFPILEVSKTGTDVERIADILI